MVKILISLNNKYISNIERGFLNASLFVRTK